MSQKKDNGIPTIEHLKEWWDLCKSYYSKDHKRMKLLDAADRGELWKSLNAKFPPYQILPDTNFISYVKTNVMASIYTVCQAADVQPTSEDDAEIVQQLNIALDRIWNLSKIGFYQFQAGERAALLNKGITQVGWNDNLTGGSNNSFYKGSVTVKNIDPMKFMRDPFATDLSTAQYCLTYDMYHKTIFKEDSRYKEKYDEYKRRTNEARQPEIIPEYDHQAKIPKGNAKDYDTLIIFWVRDEGKIHEIHTINCEEILYQKEDIKPSEFPFAELHCNLPTGGLVGTSECAKIYANNVAYNLMDSIALTAEYKNQRPPKFISSGSGLNVATFAKHGDEADRTFVVNGQADKAVHYHEFPQTSQALPQLKQALAMDVQTITGIDERYRGRDTGSITTTGGTEDMLDRVTLIDTPKITNYEEYAKQLTHLILHNFLEHGRKRKFFHKKPDSTEWETIEVDFPSLDKKTLFDYSINISSELPKNRQRVAAMANQLMEKQMQYQQEGGSQVEFITPEEWLMFQDLPMKEYMLERMGIQRLRDSIEETSQVLFEYADLVKQGMAPEDALTATARSLDEKRQGKAPEPGPETMISPEAGGGMMPPEGGGGAPAPGI